MGIFSVNTRVATTRVAAVVEAMYSTDTHKNGATMPYSIEIDFGAKTLELEIADDLKVISGIPPTDMMSIVEMQAILALVHNTIILLKKYNGLSFEVKVI